MAIPVNIGALELEMTRRCNTNCVHCMRGIAENIDMSKEIISNLLKNNDHQIISIYEVLITGGEPFLNKEGLAYFLESLIINNIKLDYYYQITNALIYDKDIMDLLEYLTKSGTCVELITNMDQFHKPIPKNILKKFKKLSFYHYYYDYLSSKDILSLGNAEKNNLGNKELTQSILEKFANNVFPYITITDINPLEIKSLYITANGFFGNEPTDATWNMIDKKYTLNILNDSLFKNAMISSYVLNAIQNERFIIPTRAFLEDYNKARQDGVLDIFFNSLTKDIIRDYLTKEFSLSRNLVK